MNYPAQRNSRRCPPHPGEVIADALEDFRYSKSAIARMLGISRQQLHAIIAGRKSVSPETAARFGKLFGNGPEIWLRLQASYDAWHALHDVDVSDVPTLTAA